MRFLKEDMDIKTNDTDDLYAVWFPYEGKKILTKEEMIDQLEKELTWIKKSNKFYIGDGLAFRNIQMIVENPMTGEKSPRVPNYSDQDFLSNLDWKD